MIVDVLLVDRHINRRVISARIETQIIEQTFHNGMQPSRADVLARFVFERGYFSHFFDCVVGKVKIDIINAEQVLILTSNRVFGNGKNIHEIGGGKTFEFDLNRESSLKFGNQIVH